MVFKIFIIGANGTMSGKPKGNLGLKEKPEKALSCLRDTGKSQACGWCVGEVEDQSNNSGLTARTRVKGGGKR